MALHGFFTYKKCQKNPKILLYRPFPAATASPQRHFSGIQANFQHTNRHQAHSNKA